MKRSAFAATAWRTRSPSEVRLVVLAHDDRLRPGGFKLSRQLRDGHAVDVLLLAAAYTSRAGVIAAVARLERDGKPLEGRVRQERQLGRPADGEHDRVIGHLALVAPKLFAFELDAEADVVGPHLPNGDLPHDLGRWPVADPRGCVMRPVEVNLDGGAASRADRGRHGKRHGRAIRDGHQVRLRIAVSGHIGERQVRHRRACGGPLNGAAFDPAIAVRAELDVVTAAPHAGDAQQRATVKRGQVGATQAHFVNAKAHRRALIRHSHQAQLFLTPESHLRLARNLHERVRR